jgi:TusA-related sulfurtransferase
VTSPAIALTVDGTALTCKGAIAKLETEFSGLPSGTVARVLLGDVPSRIDVRAWADRKGHRIMEDARRGEVFELLIAKSGRFPSAGGPAANVNPR